MKKLKLEKCISNFNISQPTLFLISLISPISFSFAEANSNSKNQEAAFLDFTQALSTTSLQNDPNNLLDAEHLNFQFLSDTSGGENFKILKWCTRLN